MNPRDKALEGITQTTMITPEEAGFFYDELIKLPDAGSMLDIGTGLGHSATMFAKAKPSWIIYTIDPYREYFDDRFDKNIRIGGIETALAWFEKEGVTNVLRIVGDSTQIPWNIRLDAVFIDGNHAYDYVKKDFEKFRPFVKKGGIILFHDAHLRGPEQLIKEITMAI